MKKNKTLVLSLIVCLLPVIAVLAVYDRLPESVATHWGVDGNPDGWSPRWFLFLLPVILAGLELVCHWGMKHGDPRSANVARPMGAMTYWIVPTVSVFAMAVTVSYALGADLQMVTLAQLLVGLLFVFIGNYLPKCRQNAMIGIRFPWTLSDVDNWNFTHRVAGRVWMVCGMVMLAAAFMDAGWVSLVALAVAVLATFGASLWYKMRHKA